MRDPIYTLKKAAVAVDVVLFTIKDNTLKVGLLKRDEPPYHGRYALPGSIVRYDEPIESTARRILDKKVHIDSNHVFLEQLYTFGQNLNRDTRMRVISIVYYGLINASEVEFNPSNLEWHSVYKLPELAFDHAEIVKYALERLRKKVLESDFAFQLMPTEFTLTELQRAYEIILNKSLDKRNFRKKMEELHILKDLKKTKMEGVHRPAKLYQFIRKR